MGVRCCVTFESFFLKERARLLRLCYLLLLDRSSAEDVAQEVMEEAWKHWAQLEGGTGAEAWITTVAVNRCRNRRRRLQLELRRLPLFAAPHSTPPDLVAEALDLRHALRRLSRRQREIVVLHYWAGMTVDECATSMGVSLGSAKQHLSRSKEHLRPFVGTFVPKADPVARVTLGEPVTNLEALTQLEERP